MKFGDPELINTTLEKQKAVTLEQVNRAAKTYLVREQRTVVTTMPGQAVPGRGAGDAMRRFLWGRTRGKASAMAELRCSGAGDRGRGRFHNSGAGEEHAAQQGGAAESRSGE